MINANKNKKNMIINEVIKIEANRYAALTLSKHFFFFLYTIFQSVKVLYYISSTGCKINTGGTLKRFYSILLVIQLYSILMMEVITICIFYRLYTELSKDK